jgi:hypothetical protein
MCVPGGYRRTALRSSRRSAAASAAAERRGGSARSPPACGTLAWTAPAGAGWPVRWGCAIHHAPVREAQHVRASTSKPDRWEQHRGRGLAGKRSSLPDTSRQSSTAHTRSTSIPRGRGQQTLVPGARRLHRLAAAQLTGSGADRRTRVAALVWVRPDHDHAHRPFVGCHRRSESPDNTPHWGRLPRSLSVQGPDRKCCRSAIDGLNCWGTAARGAGWRCGSCARGRPALSRSATRACCRPAT